MRARATLPVIGVITVVLFGLLLRSLGNGPLLIDVWWHDFVGVTAGTPAFTLAVVFANVGSSVGVAVCGAIIAALLVFNEMRRHSNTTRSNTTHSNTTHSDTKQCWRSAATLITALALGVIGSEAIKLLIARPRPSDALIHAAGASYPSGHSMGAAALAVTLVLIAADRLSRRAVWWLSCVGTLWVLAMMWSRAALQVHWLTDTLAGSVLGAAAAMLSYAIWRNWGQISRKTAG